MNYQSRKPYKETEPAASEEVKEPVPEPTAAQKERALRIKTALNRADRERRMAGK